MNGITVFQINRELFLSAEIMDGKLWMLQLSFWWTRFSTGCKKVASIVDERLRFGRPQIWNLDGDVNAHWAVYETL